MRGQKEKKKGTEDRKKGRKEAEKKKERPAQTLLTDLQSASSEQDHNKHLHTYIPTNPVAAHTALEPGAATARHT